ncbi:MAG: hypothetical protein WAN69_05125 [Candidatus Korobacteraceae bacterium]|jgi:hypothetical protein
MNRRLFVLLAVTILAASLPAESKMRGPSTSEERARALNYVQSLEQNPLGKDSLDKRMWLTEWLVQVPDLTVNTCCKELDSLDQVNETYSNQLRMQVIYSQAAFMLQHPRVKSDAEIQAAGLAGALRAYRAIQRFDPTAQYPVLDNLLSLEKKGKLLRYVEKQSVCKEN